MIAAEIRIIAIGRIKEPYLKEGISIYLKRLKPLCRLETIELKDSSVKKESESVQKYLDQTTFMLDEKGQRYTTLEFTALIKKAEGRLTFIIGGPDGFTESLKKKARLFSLSPLTFTHEIARLLLVEQIYRASMILNDRGYYQK